MRFNKAELATLAINPNTKFDREGLLVITERQEGFFRRTDVNYPRWCKLRGNLLFYLKDHEPSAATAGVLVLENCRPLIRNEEREFDGYVFILEFEGSLPQRISARTASERLDWVKSIQLASNSYLNRQIKYLEDQIKAAIAAKAAKKNQNANHRQTPNSKQTTMGNCIELGGAYRGAANDACLLNVAPIAGHGGSAEDQLACRLQQSRIAQDEDLAELPICESALSCDNLPRDSQGRLPNPRVVCSVLAPGDDFLWREHARTELIEQTANPQFLCTMIFRPSAGFNADTLLRFTVCDVRERVSLTAVPLGYAEVALGVIQDATRFRIPLRSLRGECGHITIASWAPDTTTGMRQQAAAVPASAAAAAVPPRSTTQVFEAAQEKVHRRSQSLPPKLGVRLFVPYQGCLQRVFAHPTVHTYRLHSVLGADISVHETMLESRHCFSVPLQLLSIWIQREKELLQEIAGMGELSGDWRWRQMHLLESHLKLLKDYSQAKQNVQQLLKDGGPSFKRSSVKGDESLEFLPVNLHLQRMWAQNDTLNRTGVLDIMTVGAFTRHNGKHQRKCGGLIKLLQESKSSKVAQSNACKVQAANDAVQATKQLRQEIVELMSQLQNLAKCKNSKGMMPLCNEMIMKTKTLLNIWEPAFVEEAVAFIEKHRIIEDDTNSAQLEPMSPFRKITKQLSDLDLKSPELEDFATPIVAPPDLWPHTACKQQVANGIVGAHTLIRSNSWHPSVSPSPSALDINAIDTLQSTVRRYNEHLRQLELAAEDEASTYQSLPVFWHSEETALIAKSTETTSSTEHDNDAESPAPATTTETATTATTATTIMTVTANQYAGFLDTKVMSSSPSANYYRPTEEPEPLDLTQLNIEASVMCLVSKIKFFCGRCDSPAIRLRHPKACMKRAGFTTAPTSQPPDVVAQQVEATTTVEAAGVATTGIKPLPSSKGNMLNLNLSQNAMPMPATTTTTTTAATTTTTTTKKGNKFTDGLDLSLTTDWASELRPSMRKLRHAMDRLLKTARLMHSVQRLQQDMTSNNTQSEITYRRDVCFSQALTALVSALMAKLWGTDLSPNFIRILRELGPLAYFEGLLSLYGNETDMWSDMCIAIEDLAAVTFTLVRSNMQHNESHSVPMPRLSGCRQTLELQLPVPETVYMQLSNKSTLSFKITPVFFNIGINEKATIAETLGHTREQHRSNMDNFVRLQQYYSRYRKLNLVAADVHCRHEPHLPAMPEALLNLLNFMEEQLRANVSKNVKILHLAEDACRLMCGLRFTSCKSAKDRTGMAVTLEQCRVLVQEFQLPAKDVPFALNTMRSEGTRMDNVYKNIEKRKYAFNLPQLLSLPAMYRPPVGAYGKAQT